MSKVFCHSFLFRRLEWTLLIGNKKKIIRFIIKDIYILSNESGQKVFCKYKVLAFNLYY